MSKKQTYGILASQYYIEMQMSVAEISRRLNISEKTLFEWKKNDDWEKKRARYLKTQYSTNQTLYELLHLVSKKAIEDFYSEGVLPDQKTLYFIMNMAGKLKELKTFEKETAQEKIEEINLQDKQLKETENKEEKRTKMLQEMLKALTEG